MVKCLKSNFKDAKLIIPKMIWRCHIKYKDPSDRNTVKKFQMLELCNKWYILMIFAHVILLVAVSVKISFDYKVSCYLMHE